MPKPASCDPEPVPHVERTLSGTINISLAESDAMVLLRILENARYHTRFPGWPAPNELSTPPESRALARLEILRSKLGEELVP